MSGPCPAWEGRDYPTAHTCDDPVSCALTDLTTRATMNDGLEEQIARVLELCDEARFKRSKLAEMVRSVLQ